MKKSGAFFLGIALLALFACACQAAALEQVSAETLLVDDIALTLNPNDITPLAAEAVFTTKVPTQVSITVLGEEPLTHAFDEVATEHRLPIFGLYPDAENSVEIRITEPGERYAEKTLSVTTEPLPDVFPTIDIVAADETQMEPGWTLSDFSAIDEGVYRPMPFFFDTDGAVRWYLDLTFLDGTTHLINRLANGNLLFAEAGTVYEYDMLGREINRWEMPGYAFHHEIVEKPDGNFIIAVNKRSVETRDDHIIELDRASGDVVTEWDLRQILDVSRTDLVDVENDWLHMNAFFYSEADDTLIISGRNQAVVKVTRGNELVWILAPHKGWGKAGLEGDGYETSDFLLTATDTEGEPYSDAVQQGTEAAEDFGWVWGQHAPLLLPNGNLFVFDNGLNRNFSKSEKYSRGVEYAIDETAMTVTQVWQYGKERGAEFYSSIVSDVDYLPETGNRLIAPGIVRTSEPFYALVTEVTYPERDLVFEAKLRFPALPNASPDDNFRKVNGIYRSERLPLYP